LSDDVDDGFRGDDVNIDSLMKMMGVLVGNDGASGRYVSDRVGVGDSDWK
jgi:hypothetical protein